MSIKQKHWFSCICLTFSSNLCMLSWLSLYISNQYLPIPWKPSILYSSQMIISYFNSFYIWRSLVSVKISFLYLTIPCIHLLPFYRSPMYICKNCPFSCFWNWFMWIYQSIFYMDYSNCYEGNPDENLSILLLNLVCLWILCYSKHIDWSQ